jgi:TRAP-type C4-dicarboxylate transport system substrate-binding protein
MWAPMLHMAKCRYFFTPYHVYRKVANGSEFEHARVGSVLDIPGKEKTAGTHVVLATFVRLSSRHWDSARDHQQQQITRALDLVATADEKKQGEAATKAKQVLDDVAGRTGIRTGIDSRRSPWSFSLASNWRTNPSARICKRS